MTLDEIMRDKKPGELKLRRPSWHQTDYFIPFFKDKDDEWYGLGQNKKLDYWNRSSADWQIWTPPPAEKKKKTVVVYEWLSTHGYTDVATEEYMAKHHGDRGYKKVPNSRREIEVEE